MTDDGIASTTAGSAVSTGQHAIRLLHLSDLHFRESTAWDSSPVLRALARDVEELVRDGLQPDLVVVTGDIAFSGKAEEYKRAERWLLDQLLPAAAVHPRDLLLVPGNHDVDRSVVTRIPLAAQRDLLDIDEDKRQQAQQAIRDVLSDSMDRSLLLRRHTAWIDFANRFRPTDDQLDVPWWTKLRTIGDTKVHLAGLNSAWMAWQEKEQGSLLLGLWQVNRLLENADEADLSVAILHHPWDYFPDWDREDCRSIVQSRCGVLLRGHLHKGRVGRWISQDQEILEMAAGACYDGGRWVNAYQVVELDPFTGTAAAHARVWHADRRKWVADRNTYEPDGIARESLRKSTRAEIHQAADESLIASSDRCEAAAQAVSSSQDLNSVGLEAYRSQVRDRADTIATVFKRAGGPQAIGEVYVEVRLTGSPVEEPEQADAPWPKTGRWWRELFGIPGSGLPHRGLPGEPFPLESVVELEHDRWVLLGDPGSGKTTLLHHLVAYLFDATNRLPIPMKVADLREGETLLDTVGRIHGAGCRGACEQALADRRVVVLLDGLDEVVDPSAARAAVLRAAAQAGKNSLIVASRPIGYQSPGTDFVELSLCPLAEPEQRKLLNVWVGDAARVERALDRMRRRPRLRRLAENPLLLTLVGLVMRDGKGVPERRGDLYCQAVRLLLTRSADPDRPQRRLREPGTAGDVLGWIALRLHGSESEVYPTHRIVEVLQESARLDPAVLSIWGGPETFLEEVAEITGLLVPDAAQAAGADGFHFPHRTFREYLAATALVRDIGEHGVGTVPPELLDGIARSDRESTLEPARGQFGCILADGRAQPAGWAEILALACGVLGPEAGDALVRRVAAEGCAALTQRVIADAEGVSSDTVLAVLGMERGGDDWRKRREVIEELPGLVGDLHVTVSLLWRFTQTTTNGNDLFWSREMLRRIGRGEVEGAVMEGQLDSVRQEALYLAERVLDHLDTDRRDRAQNSIREWLQEIPEGSFMMGSPGEEKGRNPWGELGTKEDYNEGPQHEVRITRSFSMLAVPVTHAMYELFDPEHRQERDAFGSNMSIDDLDDHPVTDVTWYEAALFAEWVGGRLPREAEWEYASRAGRQSRFCSGDEETDLAVVGWFAANSGGTTHSVGKKPPNDWGMRDVHGNVWEWCVDEWSESYKGRESGVLVDPRAESPSCGLDATRVIRGGSFGDAARGCRVACRDGLDPRYRGSLFGFRVVVIDPDDCPLDAREHPRCLRG